MHCGHIELLATASLTIIVHLAAGYGFRLELRQNHDNS
jgi:hypothetical protein